MNKPTLLDFYADWCGPCRIMSPIMMELEAEYEDRADIRKVNVDNEGEMATKYSIFVVPTIVLEKDGVEIRRWVGVTSKKELEKALLEAMA